MRCDNCGSDGNDVLFPVKKYMYDKYNEERKGGDGNMDRNMDVCSACFRELIDR